MIDLRRAAGLERRYARGCALLQRNGKLLGVASSVERAVGVVDRAEQAAEARHLVDRIDA
jgi:hypothetical protein